MYKVRDDTTVIKLSDAVCIINRAVQLIEFDSSVIINAISYSLSVNYGSVY